MIPFDLRRDVSRGGHKNKWNLGKTCFLQHLRCCVVKQSLVQFPCGFAIFCWSVFTCIFDALKSIGALQDDTYILVHPGLRVGGWECSVGQAAPTHPPFAVDLSGNTGHSRSPQCQLQPLLLFGNTGHSRLP